MLASVRRLAAKTAAGAPAAELAGMIADEIIRLLDADSAAVFRFDGDAIVVVGGGAAPGRKVFTRGARFPVERQMLAARILETGEPARSAGYAQDPSDAARRITALGYDVVIGAPVHVEGELWGVIYAGAEGPERLPEGSQHELGIFADLCAVAVASAEHRATLESQAAEQRALARVARAVIEGAPEQDVLDAIVRDAAALLDAPAAALLRERPDGGVEPAARWPPDDPPDPAGHRALVDAVRGEHRVVPIGDPDDTARESDMRPLGRAAGWVAPIEIGGRRWGALAVALDKGTPVPPDAATRIGRISELSGVAIANVESRRELVEQLLATERFAALVDLSDDFIGIADLEGRSLYLNPGGHRLLGLEPNEVWGMSVRDFLTDEGKQHYDAVSKPQTRANGSFRGETTLRHARTGEAIPVAVSAYLIPHPLTGEPIAVAVVQRDLRDQRRAEVALRERAAEVEQLASARRFLLVEVLRGEERMRRQIADALHDHVLQELYAARLDLDRAGTDDEAIHRVRAAVDGAARQLRDAVGDLHPAATSTHGLEARLRSVLEQGGDRAGFGHRLDYSVEGPTDADELVLALLREFVHNAVKHADATFLTVRVAEEDGHVVLTVDDDGRGMPEERPAEALRSGHIGLASARERVEAIGGRLQLTSTPGEGTRIRVAVPPAGGA
jgi:PAS domain S-box-containing protein